LVALEQPRRRHGQKVDNGVEAQDGGKVADEAVEHDHVDVPARPEARLAAGVRGGDAAE